MEQQNQFTQTPVVQTYIKPRPTFITVLCILSFVGIGLVVLVDLVNIIRYSSVGGRERLEQASELLQSVNSPLGNFIGDTDEFISNIMTMSWIGIVCALICLAGVLLMWNLKRVGFFIYTVAELTYPVVALTMLGKLGLGSTLFASLMAVISVISLIFAIGFVVMYAVNLKHLK